MPLESDTDNSRGTGSAGGGQYVVISQGDCLSSIAEQHGLFWQTIWNHPNNAGLKRTRREPNILLPGDVVFVPDKAQRFEARATDKRHSFIKRGTPAKLRIRVLEEPEANSVEESHAAQPPAEGSGESLIEDPLPRDSRREDRPRADVPYVLIVEARLISGKTDHDGRIECFIPPGARTGRLILEPGTENEKVIPLHLGHLDPMTEFSGIKQRLANLGLYCGDLDNTTSIELEDCLRIFQTKYGLNVSGEADQATRDKLREVHGS